MFNIEEIRARHEAEIREPNKWTFNRAETAHADRATLLRALDAMAEENARLREALQAIAYRHIPDQPPAYDVSEADYARKHYMELRMLARAALKETGQ